MVAVGGPKTAAIVITAELEVYITIFSWNMDGIRTKVQELGRWLSDTKVDVVLQEVQMAGPALSVPWYQITVVSGRAQAGGTEVL